MANPSLEGNLRRYQLIVGSTSALFWIPTGFLFFIDEFGLGAALRLGAIYYLAVVVFEVPSGWFSDRIGRVPTLRFVALFWMGAFCALGLAEHFAVAALGQVLMAIGYAFLSGTDVTFHFDSLEALGHVALPDVVFTEAHELALSRDGACVAGTSRHRYDGAEAL